MKRRGRPPYPDLLTPREQEVLALLREGLSNEDIAQRLGVSLAGAKYHVSEILGKLGVSSREEAARWEPQARPWWLGALAPIAPLRHRLGWAPQVAIATVTIALAAGVGLLLWGLVRTSGSEPSASTVATQPKAPFCTVELPQSWRSALAQGEINLPAADYFYAAAVSADATQVFGSLYSDAWTGVVAVDRKGSITRVRPFDNPNTDSIWNAAFEGRWLAWTERHSEQFLGGADLHVWDSSTGEVLDLAQDSAGVLGPVIAQGRLAWAVRQHNLLGTYDLHLYSLVERHDRVISSEEFRQPMLFSGSKLLLFESHTPTGGQFRMIDIGTGELSQLSQPFASIFSTETVSVSNDLAAWSDGSSVFAWRLAEPKPMRIFEGTNGDIVGAAGVAGHIVGWQVQGRQTATYLSMAADLRSGSIASFPDKTTLVNANANAFVFDKPLGPPVKNGDEHHVTLNHFEIDVVNTADLPPLPGCSS